ncbi:MFS putative major facilitator superfamily transporter [Teratosphaeria nubilosa]|uniref:MFS putative major facilitator superfamily transporter n=1 Tax=Teratosphaeria nubilosa TaxID=161662 RepID=A0A6G1KVM1_9PEZI|nr:MFS putative major facilitator superfamily transporter [Teratosphaeria nubilosa]
MRLSPKLYQFLVSVFASVGSILYGYDLGVIAEAIASDNFINTFHPTTAESGAVVSVFTGGAFFGAFFAGPVGDYIGRRLTIMLGAVIFLLGGGLQAGAQSLAYLYAGRVIAGLAVGFLVMIIPLYQAELAHPDIRGRVTALQQFMLGIGALVASWVAYGCYTNFPASTSKQWRISLGIQLIPAGFLAALILLFPESPRWLIDHGKVDEGLRTLAKLHAHGDENDPWVRAEFEQIQEAITYEHEHEAKSYVELFTNKSSFRRLFLACSLQAACQMTGVSAIQYYSPTIFAQIGIPTDKTLQYQGINSIIALIAQACCIWLIDTVGRRWANICGNIGNGITFIIATALLACFPPGVSDKNAAGWGFIIMTWLYNFSFSCTIGPLTWIVPSEIFDTRTRSKGVSIGVMVSFAFNTMIGQVTPIAMKDIGWKFYLLFVICNFTNALFFWAIQPETKKRPLEEMNYLFTNAPLFVPTMNMKDYEQHDLENRVAEAERKASIVSQTEEISDKTLKPA